MLNWPELTLQPINLWSLPKMYKNDDALDFTFQPFEQDMAFLKKLRPYATEEECEDFADKVAMLIVDLGIDESIARTKAYSQMYEKA